MRLNINAEVAVKDARQCVDPFGMGTVWTIRRVGHQAFIDWQADSGLRDPKLAKVAQARIAGLLAGLSGAELQRAIFEAASEVELNLKDLLSNATKNEGIAAHLVEAIGGLRDVDSDELVEYTPELVVEIFENTTPLPAWPCYCRKCKAEQLPNAAGECDACKGKLKPCEVDDKHEDPLRRAVGFLDYAGMTYGGAWRTWILDEAGNAEEFRNAFLEEAGKN